jgi:CHRD domain
VALVVAGIATAALPRFFVVGTHGRLEVPVVDTKARGQAILHVTRDGNSLDFKLIVWNIQGVTQAHIHCAPPGVNGNIAVFLFGFDPAGVTTTGILSAGTLTDADILPIASSAACPGGIGNLDDLIEKMKSGGAYVNVHTLAHPAGEMRGNI